MNTDPSIPYTLRLGTSALIISVPHAGLELPADMRSRLTPVGAAQPDADWHVDKLYDFAAELDATLLVARYSRYLVDLNRPPDDAPLYANAAQTGLCPTLSFAGEPLYSAGAETGVEASSVSYAPVSAAEVVQRRAHYWQPYHEALRAQIARSRARRGYALLLDAHSIRSEVPRLFAGRLPDLNVGTFDARSCDPRVIATTRATLAAQSRFTWVIDGRFKGGYITRHYGQPAQDVHALQIELAQSSYMDEGDAALPVVDYDAQRAAALRTLLRPLLSTLLALPLKAAVS